MNAVSRTVHDRRVKAAVIAGSSDLLRSAGNQFTRQGGINGKDLARAGHGCRRGRRGARVGGIARDPDAPAPVSSPPDRQQVVPADPRDGAGLSRVSRTGSGPRRGNGDAPASTILGIRATGSSGPAIPARSLAERTTDWYAQDSRGNVWYLGERTAELDAAGGRSAPREAGRQASMGPAPGSTCRHIRAWRKRATGVLQGARRGPVQDPKPRATGQHAGGRILDHALLTEETTRLEPGAVDHKLYVEGIGTVVEQSIKGGNEMFVLATRRRLGVRARQASCVCGRPVACLSTSG